MSEAAPEGKPAAAAPKDDAPLVVLEPCAADRELLEGLQEPLGRPVWALDPDQFGSDMLEEVAEACALIVEWDLGTRLGLDVVEALAADERTRGVPVALASAAPTRSMVATALRAGARTFLGKPYDAEEIRRRLLPAPAAADAEAGAAAEATDAAPDSDAGESAPGDGA